MALTPRIALTAATLAACAAERIEPTISASINDGSSSSTESTSLVLTQGGTSGTTSPTDLPPTTAATSGTSPLGEPCDVYTQACGPGLKCQPDESVECPSHEGFCADVPLPKSSLAQACIMSGKLCDQHDNCDAGLYCAFAAWLGTGWPAGGPGWPAHWTPLRGRYGPPGPVTPPTWRHGQACGLAPPCSRRRGRTGAGRSTPSGSGCRGPCRSRRGGRLGSIGCRRSGPACWSHPSPSGSHLRQRDLGRT